MFKMNRINSDVDALASALFTKEPHILDQFIGCQCYKKFTGNNPAWGIDVEINGQMVTVNRCRGEEVEFDNYITNLPGDKPQIYNIEATQKAWGHNELGQYVFGIIKFRIYKSDVSNCSGLPADHDSVIILKGK